MHQGIPLAKFGSNGRSGVCAPAEATELAPINGIFLSLSASLSFELLHGLPSIKKLRIP